MRRIPVFIIVLIGFFVFDAENVRSQTDTYTIIRSINFSGNKITRRKTLLRELEFAPSDTFRKDNMASIFAKAKENLLNTSLFNFVTVKPLWDEDSANVDVDIELLERWYIWPYPLLEIADRNFNAWWENKDFSRLNYGVYLVWWNFTGRKDKLKLLIRLGHEQKFGFFYELPSFNRAQNLGFEIGLSHSRKHEIGVETINNELNYYRNDELFPEKRSEAYFRLLYRPGIHQTQYIEIKYQYINLMDSVVMNYPNFSINGQENLKHFSLSYKYIQDHRDYKPYPLKGYYFDVELRKVGLGLLQSQGVDFLYIKSSLRKFWKLSQKWYFAGSLQTKFSTKQFQPYSLQRGLGYDYDYVRGYELNIFDGQNYGLFRTNLKYELIPRKVKTIKYIKSEKFNKIYYAYYLNLFFDCAYTHDRYTSHLNPLVNEIQYGYGIGLDFVTYYDIVLRAEFTINKQNKSALYLHVRAPL